MSANIHGKHHRTILNQLDRPFGLSVTFGRIFWSDWGRAISSADMTGNDMSVEFNASIHTIGDIYVYNSNRSNVADTNDYPCRQGTHSCSHLCLPNASNRGYRCACTTGVAIDGDTCNPGNNNIIVLVLSIVSLVSEFLSNTLNKIFTI